MAPKSFLLANALLLLGLVLASCDPGIQEATAWPTFPPLEATLTAAPTATPLLFASPTPPRLPSPAPPASPTPTPLPPVYPIFLISWDGGQAGRLNELIASGALPHFAGLVRSGLQAEYALSADPSLSAPAHNAISSGSYPAHTGIVSNRYHLSDDSFYWYRSGFYEGMDQAEPVWVTASRAGLTTATLFFAGGSPQLPEQAASYTIGYGESIANSRQEKVSLSAARTWENPPVSYSPLLEGSFSIPEVARIYLLVVDGSDDGVRNYDAVLLNTSPQVNPDTPRLAAGQWGPLVLLPETTSGADFLIQNIQPGGVTLYHTAVNHNLASPSELLEALNTRFSFFPAGPDEYAHQRGWISSTDFLHMLSRSTRWMAEVSAWVYLTYHPDLLFTWQDGFDAAGHAFYLQDPRQTGYTPELAEQSAASYLQAASYADQSLEIMLAAIDLERTTVLMVSDHGMAPVHTTVYLNTVLEGARLLVLDRRDYVIVEKTKAIAFASGGAAHVYIHLQDRERKGLVSAADYPAVQQQIVDLLVSLVDPETGEPVFQRVLTREQLAMLGLDHLNSGDVFAQANPGYELDGWRGKSSVFEPATISGSHGYDSALPEMHAFFIAAGAGVPAGGVIPPVRVVDYAPTIAALLRFEPARWVDGDPIPALVNP